jgi:hypothetical protein
MFDKLFKKTKKKREFKNINYPEYQIPTEVHNKIVKAGMDEIRKKSELADDSLQQLNKKMGVWQGQRVKIPAIGGKRKVRKTKKNKKTRKYKKNKR